MAEAAEKVKVEEVEEVKEKSTEDELMDERIKRLNLTKAVIEKQFGKGAIFSYNEDEKYDWPAVSTGAVTLDRALGIGGIPRGRITEIFGPESSGKSTLCLTIVAEMQKMGGICAYVDSEHALDPKYTRTLGVDFRTLMVSQPGYGEEALDIVDMLCRTGEVDLIVVDSVASLTPKAELDGTMHNQSMGSLAKMMSQHMRKINAIVDETQTTLIFVNQIREKIGVMFGSPETTPGGRALPFWASARIDIRRTGDIKTEGDKIGHTVRATVRKNKLAPPFKQGEFDILWGKGINKFGAVLDVATDMGLLKKSGNWYKTLDDEPLGNGRNSAYESLASDLELYEKLKEEILHG